MNVSPPSSQKADVCPIGFVLVDQALGSAPISMDLAVRPEELTRTDPSRMTVQQTLGGAWADNFGAGISTINISGHTGWRPTLGNPSDGEARFKTLKQQVFNGWHARRILAVKAGIDPDLVQLIFSDVLNKQTVVVAPNNFVLRRSKSRPLLFQYQIALTVLDQNVDQAALGFGGLLDKATIEQFGLDSLTNSINELTSFINEAQNFVDRTLVAPVSAFMNQTVRLYGAVRGAIAAADGLAGSLISVAQMTAQAGLNIFRTQAAIVGLPGAIKNRLMQVSGAYSNILCVLRNALHQQIYYSDYSALFGSSNCSSTAGGRPISILSGQNPFYSVVPTRPPLPVSLTDSAQGSLRTIASNDPVLDPMPIPTLAIQVSSLANGMAVAA